MKLGDHLRAFMGRAVMVASVCMVLGIACSPTQLSDLAEGCAINTDCNSPLVCAFQHCHNQCQTTQDCTSGLRCVASDRPFHVCQLTSERVCVYHSDCPEGQVCAVDGQCRDQCHTDSDCLAAQLCVAGTCADIGELRDGGLPVVKRDAGPSTGQSCSYNSQCPNRLICLKGSCQVECLSSADCPSGRQCVQNRCQVRVCPDNDAGAGILCAFSSDCPAPLVCRSGSCTCECRLGGDCPSGYDCLGNRCVPGNVDTIGPEGGTVVSADGRLTLKIPPDALNVRVHLTMDMAQSWPTGALGPVFEVRPTGTTFASPVTFIYRYQSADIAPVAPADLRLAVANGPTWSRLSTSVNASMGTATAQTTHLSTYGLVGPDGPPPDASMDGPAEDAGPCNAASCSSTVRDGCCPSGCTALTDSDCAGCGNGRLEAGETCDPPGSCPACDDQNDCTTDTQTGSAATCNVQCQNVGKTCSNAGNDRCCPAGCTAQNDSDCAACGDGVVDPLSGETCDPPGTCPTACAPGMCWDVRTFTGSPMTCNARCSTTQLPCSGATSDGCCPPGCNTSPANRDVDCPSMCGNGIVDVGETCDPLASCPTTCSQMGCTLRALSKGGTCQAQCQTAGTQTACANGDGCCPGGCNAVNDNNCSPVCGNGVLEAGELCEGASCPTSCANQACTVRTLQGTMCQRQCVSSGTISTCVAGDGCCPTNCTAMNDADCTGCGNGRIDPGETCDPPGSCPVCDDQNDCTTDTQTGSAATCNLVCQHAAKTCSNAGKDRCCPAGCTAQNDSDCAGCGDGVIDANAGETCDPPSSCPTACPVGQCYDVQTFTGSPATCNARCSTTLRPCSGTTMDGCCPPGCNTSPANRDVDCPATCGNGIVDGPSETCDPVSTCPMSCPQQACMLRSLANAGTCTAACVNTGTQTMCVNSDGCCPGACNSLNDNNCSPVCGNGVLEMGELCDGASCPTSCPNIGCTARTLQGTGCQRQCVASATIMTCIVASDGCCPATGCNALTDGDCAPVCGNGVVEPGELCDGASCPTSCANQGCTRLVVVGTGCQRHCAFAGDAGADAGPGGITGCINGDNCCPNPNPNNCNALNDNNCTPVCGNGVTEPPEKCDGANCPTAATCVPDANTDRVLTGSAANCDAVCTATPRQCVPDGFCPTMCSSANDPDCPPPNDQCGNAIDISSGGTFTVDIPAVTKQDTDPDQACQAKGLDVFYTFTLSGSEFVFFSVLDTKLPTGPVPVTLELYADQCPPPTGGRAMICDAGVFGRNCGGNPFPLITSSNAGALAGKPIGPGKFFLTVRATGAPGRWNLTYHHVPLSCAQQGEPSLPALGQQLAPIHGGTTCQSSDSITPSCLAATTRDDTLIIYKCPSQSFLFTTCDDRTTAASGGALSAVLGSVFVSGTKCLPTSAGKEVACGTKAISACTITANPAEIQDVGGAEPGILTLSVDMGDVIKGSDCGPYGLDMMRK